MQESSPVVDGFDMSAAEEERPEVRRLPTVHTQSPLEEEDGAAWPFADVDGQPTPAAAPPSHK